MLCKSPKQRPGGVTRCGGCLPCRIYLRRQWSGRMLLEQMETKASCFLTLTYKDDPYTLVPNDLQLFLKRLRKDQKVRFFGVGEYGEDKERPHYHLALFGHGGCKFRGTRFVGKKTVCCEDCERMNEVWKLGEIHMGTLTRASAEYVASYTMKKMTNAEDKKTQEFLKGRHPEFARMSTQPGIGFVAMQRILIALYKAGDFKIPSKMVIGGKVFPTPKYLRNMIRDHFRLDTKEEQLDYSKTLNELMNEIGAETVVDAVRLHGAPKVQALEVNQRRLGKRKKL